MNINKKLQALAAVALALPGIAGANEDDNQYEFGYRFHSYSEDALSAKQTGNQPIDRYEVRANQFNLSAQVGDDLSLNLAYQHENMAGASAWFTRKNQDGDVVQVMSGASISDSRQDFKLSGAYKLENQQIGLSIAASEEDDYESLSFGANISFELDNKLSTFSLAADVSNDDVTPIDSDLFNYRVVSESKRSTSLLAGWSRIIDKNSIFQLSIGYTYKNGYLSDPYKQVFVNFDLLNDTRPTSRVSKTLSARYRLSLKSTGGTLHGDYRYYTDSWDIDSHTYELSYYQPLGWDMQIIPSIRLYKQDAALLDFTLFSAGVDFKF